MSDKTSGETRELVLRTRESQSDEAHSSEGRIPKMSHGKGLWGDKIIAPKPELFKHKCPLFPSGHISAYICGASGTGKTTVLLEMLPNIEKLSQICLFTLIAANPVNLIIQKYSDEKGIQFMQSDDPMNGQKALEEFIKGKPEGTYGLCIFDDFVKQNARPDDPYKVCMVSVCQFLRNEGYHNIMISQSPKSIPEGARNNVNLRICFKLESPLSVSVMRNEFIGSGMGPKHYFERVYKAMLQGGRFSYFVLVSDQDDPRIFIHQQKKGEDHLQRIPLYDQYISQEREATSSRDDDEEEFDD